MTNPTEGRLQQQRFLAQADCVTVAGLVDKAPLPRHLTPPRSEVLGSFFLRRYRSSASHSCLYLHLSFSHPHNMPRPSVQKGHVQERQGHFYKIRCATVLCVCVGGGAAAGFREQGFQPLSFDLGPS